MDLKHGNGIQNIQLQFLDRFSREIGVPVEEWKGPFSAEGSSDAR
jgi:hypothetical protein